MADVPSLKQPWLVAVWPGMGNVAISAGYYLMAKLGMHGVAEFAAEELFDIEHVEVKRGLIRPGRLPRSRFFVWKDPRNEHDIVVFIGEAQPPQGKRAFCQKLIDYARSLQVERVFTFAAMATDMHPQQRPRVFGAATDEAMLAELRDLELEFLDDSRIGGLNGVLLGVAAEQGLHGACLLGEMPQLFAQLPFPKASLAILERFKMLTGIDLDLGELAEQSEVVERSLLKLMEQVQAAAEQQEEEGNYSFPPDEEDEEDLSLEEIRRIEELFAAAEQDRSRAYELKRELDVLGVFPEYEDRFLDLFKKSD